MVYNMQLYLQWPTNKKSYMIYQTAPFSMTLNDPCDVPRLDVLNTARQFLLWACFTYLL